MKRFSNIYERIYDMENLKLAHRNARKDKALYKEVKMVDSNEEYFLWKIQKLLMEKKYHICPKDYTVSIIRDKTKNRELRKLKYYPHRIIQRAIMLQLEKIFSNNFCDFTCASVKWRGWKQIRLLMNKYLNDREWTKYCLKIDISKYYPSVNHRILKKLLRRKFKDPDLLRLLDMIIDSFPWRKWLPIWSYLSQFLANFYLSYFDHRLKEKLHCKYVLRYMDDIVILDWSKKHLRYIFRRMKGYLTGNLNLKVKDNRQIFPTGVRWVDFVGYRYFYDYTLLRKTTALKLKSRYKHLKRKQDHWMMRNFQERCSINSYNGRLIRCDSRRLHEKYIEPLYPYMLRYYRFRILWGDMNKKNLSKLKRYRKKILAKKWKKS